MNRYKLVVAALFGASMLAAGAASAKTLVYCSEGSPENFTPADQHDRHQPRCRASRLQSARRVRARIDHCRARPCRKLGGLRGRQDSDLQPAQGRQAPFRRKASPRAATSTPMMSSSRSSGSGRPTIPITVSRAAPMTISTTWACRTCWRASRRLDDYTVVFKLKKPERADHRQPGDGFRHRSSRPNMPTP